MVLFWTIFWGHASYSKNKCHTKDLNLHIFFYGLSYFNKTTEQVFYSEPPPKKKLTLKMSTPTIKQLSLYLKKNITTVSN